MLQLLKKYVEENSIGFHYEEEFSGFLPLTRETGRIVLCDQPRTSPDYYRPSSITFWVQQAGATSILATWNGRYYLTQDESALVEVIHDLYQDESITNAPYEVPAKFLENRPINEIVTFALLKKDILLKYDLSEANASDWYCQTKTEDDRLKVSKENILEFLKMNCEYSIDQYSWCNFSCKGISGYLRLPSTSFDELLEIAVLGKYSDTDEIKAFFGFANGFFGGLFV